MTPDNYAYTGTQLLSVLEGMGYSAPIDDYFTLKFKSPFTQQITIYEKVHVQISLKYGDVYSWLLVDTNVSVDTNSGLAYLCGLSASKSAATFTFSSIGALFYMLPQLPTESGTYTLKCVSGDLGWSNDNQ